MRKRVSQYDGRGGATAMPGMRASADPAALSTADVAGGELGEAHAPARDRGDGLGEQRLRIRRPAELGEPAREEAEASDELALGVADGARRRRIGAGHRRQHGPRGAPVDVRAHGLGEHEVVVAPAGALDHAAALGVERQLAYLVHGRPEPVALDRAGDPDARLRPAAALEVDGDEELGLADDALAAEHDAR